MSQKDPIGNAIWDYHTNNNPKDIIVASDILEDDTLPVHHLFREFNEFPKLEIEAMKHCTGKVLDTGAGAGPHTKHLIEKGFDVTTLEISSKASEYLKIAFPEATHYSDSILNFKKGTYDTILLLMNGIGIAGTLNEVPHFLNHISSLLAPGGSIICDSTDVKYIFEDDEGGLWVDLNANYYGEFKFNMKYKESESDWFNWVYLDIEKFQEVANKVGLEMTLLAKDEQSFLVQLRK
ncbi:class I SAM-dependent methyltransferase [Brumimicrobium aurantiacum]|uniref:Methyltransferase domain-containing protein n=1 Tax=Brumimicrobium aurantiacum TaxID=1737063 RepID=A0A3E1F0C2_9FLAO|nr:methyltransferase domain-containing protein [Brumimicrobium aurantiacum]RFC55157.1 methyltransferase domain-containing protein [Brumimicrobium aurantiacum]